MIWQQLKETLARSICDHCCSSKHLRRLHARVIYWGLRHNLYVSSLLITKYFHFGDSQAAHRVFDTLRERPNKALLWNSLIKGYLRSGQPSLALDVYHEMIGPPSQCEPDKQTFHLVITACTDLSVFELGSQVEGHARSRGLDSDLLCGTALVNMYCKAGDTQTARRLFDGMPVRDAVSWNAMISGYSQAGQLCDSMDLFKHMRFVHGILPTEGTIVSLISGCAQSNLLEDGEAMHAHVVKIGFETNVFILNSLLEMYIECNCLNLASELFDRMPLNDAVSWSTIIGGYVQYHHPNDALKLFDRMVLHSRIVPTRPVLLNVLLACADLGDWQKGKCIEDKYIMPARSGFQSDLSLITALMYMHAKCGQMELSLKLLNKVSTIRQDVIAWNAMIKACTELRQVDWVMELALEMQRRGTKPNSVTFLMLLPLLSSVPLPRKGMKTHAEIIKRGFKSERSIANSLIDMYAKCGRIEDSCKVFNGIKKKDVVSWSSMIKAYAWNGNAKEALNLFQMMRERDTTPNDFTFLAILSACSHGGFVELGREFFRCMKEHYGLEPSVEHFACMIDIYCRAGLLNDVYQLLQNEMPEACTTAPLWGTLLSACRFHGDLAIGEAAARHLFFLEPGNAANYMMLADIYISAGRRADAIKVGELLKAKGLERRPGSSWFEGG